MTLTSYLKHFIRMRLRRRIHHLVRWWCDHHGLVIVERARLEAIKSENRRLRHTDGPYRWTLSRNWDIDRFESHVGWIMFNPSTADSNVDDPTIRRCMGYARRWGYAGIHVMNLFAYRATEPAELRKAKDPIASRGRVDDHDALLLNMIGTCPLIIAAWGTHGAYMNRGQQVIDLFAARSIPLHCLRTSKDGHPCHPLYLPAALTPTPFTKVEAQP